jgi:hypothetical protein
MVIDSLNEQFQYPMTDEVFAKVAWIYDPVAKQIGHPKTGTCRVSFLSDHRKRLPRQPPGFRTIQACPRDLPASRW